MASKNLSSRGGPPGYAPDGIEARGSQASTSSGLGPSLGTTRNRSEIFFKYRRHATGSSKPFKELDTNGDAGLETAKLMESALGGLSDTERMEAGITGVSASLPPRYVEFRDDIRRDMQSIRDRMAELRSLHSRASLSKFDDGRDDEIAVEVATQQVTKLFRRCEARLQGFARGAAATSADEKVQRNMQRTLASDLQRLSVQFRKQQKQYLERLRARDGGGGAAAGALSLLEGSSGAGREDASYDPGFSDVQALAADSISTLVDERDREVTRIMTSIHELAQIMKDLSVLVIDQGTVLDRIDYNLEQTATTVEEGVTQLRKAERAQRRGAAAACVMVLLVAVAVMLLIVLLKAALFF